MKKPPPLPSKTTTPSRKVSVRAATLRFVRTARPWVAPLGGFVVSLLLATSVLQGRRQLDETTTTTTTMSVTTLLNTMMHPGGATDEPHVLASPPMHRGADAAIERWWTRHAPTAGRQQSLRDSDDVPSTGVLEGLVLFLSHGRSQVLTWVEQWRVAVVVHDGDWTPATIRSATSQCLINLLLDLVPVAFVILEIYVALHVAIALLNLLGFLVECVLSPIGGTHLPTVPTVSEIRDAIFRPLFDFVRFHVPGVQRTMDVQAHTMMSESNESVFHKDPQRAICTSLPWEPVPKDQLLHQLKDASHKENAKWRKGRVSGTVYTDDLSQHQSEFMSNIYQLYAFSNPLHPGCWPSMNHAEAEVIGMCGTMLHAPLQPPDQVVAGCVTSGGTESILLAIRAHLQHYGKRRGIARPNIICGSTAHAALNKAAEMYGIQLIVVNCNPFRRGGGGRRRTTTMTPPEFGLDPLEVRRRITLSTIMIYASAPAYPQGIVDPVVELAQVAQEYDIGLHVDACLGGFVLAFLDDSAPSTPTNDTKNNSSPSPTVIRPNIPVFDFRNEGVTSMSIDTHKYGYSTKGTSVVLYRTRELRHAQYFTYPHWSGGMYATPTLAGSRPGALTVCAWAAMKSLGRSGYRERACRIVTASRQIAEGIATRIPGLQLLTPVDHATVVVSFGSSHPERMNIYRVSDGMTSRGWVLNELQNPPCLHVCVTLTLSSQVEVFLRDLQAAVDEAHNEGDDGKSKGTAGIYGAVATLPDGPIECVLNAFTELSLAP